MNRQLMNEFQQHILRRYARSLFDLPEQLQRLREAFPESVDGDVYDFLEQCVAETGDGLLRESRSEDKDVSPPPSSTPAPELSPVTRFKQLVSAWRSAPAQARRTDWPTTRQVPLLFGSIWTVQPDASMAELDWGITERLPMVVLAETVEDDSISPAGAVVQVFPLSIWPEFATDADLIISGAPLPQPMIVEVWNEQPLLCSQFLHCLGALPGQDLKRLANIAIAVRTGSSGREEAATDENQRGQPLGTYDDSRRLFQQIELLRTLPLRVPALAALSGTERHIEDEHDHAPNAVIYVFIPTMLGINAEQPAMAAAATDPERPLRTVVLCCDMPMVELSVSECVDGEFIAIEVLRDDNKVMAGAKVVDDLGAELGVFSTDELLKIQLLQDTALAVHLANGEFLSLYKVER